jgi:hypothetical protein
VKIEAIAPPRFRIGESAVPLTVLVSGYPIDPGDNATVSWITRDAFSEETMLASGATIEDVAETVHPLTGLSYFAFTLSAPDAIAGLAEAGLYLGAFKIETDDGATVYLPDADSRAIVLTVGPGLSPVTDVTPRSGGTLQTQVAHGFSALQWVYEGPSGWALAKADDPATLADAMVLTVVDDDSFRVIYLDNAEHLVPDHGFGADLSKFYLSQETAGLSTTSMPATEWRQQLGRIKTSQILFLASYPPEYIPE